MTPKQITQIERHLAKVLGWHVELYIHTMFHDPSKREVYCDSQGFAQIDVAGWHPCSDPAQAAMVRAEIGIMGWRYRLGSIFTEELLFSCEIWKPTDPIPGHLGRAWHTLPQDAATAPTESLACCVAMFEATGGMLEEK